MLTEWGQTFGLDPAQMVATANDSVNCNTQEQISIERIQEAGKAPGIEEISQLHYDIKAKGGIPLLVSDVETIVQTMTWPKKVGNHLEWTQLRIEW